MNGLKLSYFLSVWQPLFYVWKYADTQARGERAQGLQGRAESQPFSLHGASGRELRGGPLTSGSVAGSETGAPGGAELVPRSSTAFPPRWGSGGAMMMRD